MTKVITNGRILKILNSQLKLKLCVLLPTEYFKVAAMRTIRICQTLTTR